MVARQIFWPPENGRLVFSLALSWFSPLLKAKDPFYPVVLFILNTRRPATEIQFQAQIIFYYLIIYVDHNLFGYGSFYNTGKYFYIILQLRTEVCVGLYVRFGP
jgi:hypothetical protein